VDCGAGVWVWGGEIAHEGGDEATRKGKGRGRRDGIEKGNRPCKDELLDASPRRAKRPMHGWTGPNPTVLHHQL
jgi:hypothetical protein